MRRTLYAAIAAAILLPASALAQQSATPPAAVPPARPEDVASIDAIIAATYDVISGPAGEKRNWDRFRSLFVPGARLIPTGKRPAERGGGFGHRVMTPEEYITTSGAVLEERGFFERELGRRVERYGNIAHVFSAYDSKARQEDEKPFARGINSFQLHWDGSRWWVVSIFWAGETPENPIPADMIGAR